MFTCITSGSSSHEWISSQYIDDMPGDALFFVSRDPEGTRKDAPNGASFAILTMVNDSDVTMIILESQLHIVVSDQYNSSQIICSNTGSGTDVPINFNVGKNIIQTLIITYMYARIEFQVTVFLLKFGMKIIILLELRRIFRG